MRLSHSQQIGNELYQKIGKLFYAVAIADKTVHIKELDRLKSLVREKWLPFDDIEDEYGTDAAFQIEIVFDWLLEYEKKCEDCFREFKVFFKDNQKLFSEELKNLILETANAIASAFANKNKAELIVLGNLNLLLKS